LFGKEHKTKKMPILADYFMSVTVPPTGRILPAVSNTKRRTLD